MKKNIIANIAGRFWSILSNFAFIPLYIKYLGFESYSVISFTLMITGIMAVLDGGLTATLSREFARKDNTEADKYRIFRSLEAGYLLVVFLCIAIIFLASGYIGQHWISVKSFTPDQIALFLKIMSFEIGFQFLFRFYMGGLLGLEKQVEANMYQIAWGLFRNGLVLIAIYLYPSLQTFFLWQTISTIIFTLLIKFALQNKISSGSRFAFSLKIEKDVIQKVGKFAGGMMLIALVAALNTQLDKVTISKLLSLENLGYYTLAISVSQGLIILTNPISTALLPRFTAHYSSSEKQHASELFGKVSIGVSVLIFSLMVNMAFFSSDLIWIWTGNQDIAEKTYKLVPIVAFAYSMIAIQMLPYNIAIANGYTKLNNILGLLSLGITIPGYYIATKTYGAIGAAAVFCFVQTVTTIIYLYFINKKFLDFAFFKEVFLKQFLLPLMVTAGIGALLYFIPNYFNGNRVLDLMWIGFCTLTTLSVSIFIFVPKSEIKNIISATNFKR